MNTNSQRTAKKPAKKKSVLQAIRLILQIAFFIFLPALYINAFNEIKMVLGSIADQSFDIATLWPQVIECIAIIPVTILLGRFFCGWMCAFGAFSDFIYKFSNKVFKVKFKMPEKADAALKYVKYGILFLAIFALWNTNFTFASSANPWDAFGMLFTVGAQSDFAYVAANLTLGLIFLLLISLASFFIERFFCRYLCPLGAVFSLFSHLRIAKIEKPTKNCGRCRICTNACAMGIPLYKSEKVSSGECIQCMQCVSACPRRNANLTLAGNDVRPLAAGTMAAIAIAGIYQTSSFALAASVDDSVAAVTSTQSASVPSASATSILSASSTSQPAASSAAATTSASASASASPSASASASSSSSVYQDGTYTGSGTGFRGATTTVSVTVKGDAITDVTVESYGDDRPYFERAASSVISDIVSQQSTNVDAVSGATYSSNGIMDAVADALSQAAI